MRMTVEIDPQARSKKCRAYSRTYYQNVGRFNRDPVQHRQALQRWRAAHPLYHRAKYYERNIDRWIVEGGKREKIFHSINDARGRGELWLEIAKTINRNPQSFMRAVRETWDWGNLDGRDWARRTDAELVKAVCDFMTHDDADYADLTDALATDDEFALLNPDPIYQEGWFHGVCQHSIPRYVVNSRFELKEGMHKCVICGTPFKAKRSVKTCSAECAAENRRRYINDYQRKKRKDDPAYRRKINAYNNAAYHRKKRKAA